MKILPLADGLHPAIPAGAFTIINLDDDSYLFTADGPWFDACHQPGARAEHQRVLFAADALAVPVSGAGALHRFSTKTARRLRHTGIGHGALHHVQADPAATGG